MLYSIEIYTLLSSLIKDGKKCQSRISFLRQHRCSKTRWIGTKLDFVNSIQNHFTFPFHFRDTPIALVCVPLFLYEPPFIRNHKWRKIFMVNISERWHVPRHLWNSARARIIYIWLTRCRTPLNTHSHWKKTNWKRLNMHFCCDLWMFWLFLFGPSNFCSTGIPQNCDCHTMVCKQSPITFYYCSVSFSFFHFKQIFDVQYAESNNEGMRAKNETFEN